MRAVLLLVGLVACASREVPREGPREVPSSSAPAVARSSSVVDHPPLDAGAPAADPGPAFSSIAGVMFADRLDPVAVSAACPDTLAADARIACAYDERFRGDAKAAALAKELWTRFRIVVGVEVAHTMDGGYRGQIRIVPAVPTGADRKHLEWITQAMNDVDAVFDELGRHGPKGEPARYRYRPITLRFMRSVAARTPSAYASGWTVAWNLDGSLHTSAEAVRDTLVHEIFHLNDYAHLRAGDAWSFDALGATFAEVVRKCGVKTPCLAPFSPNDTQVRGGTYYSFQPGNGVREYAAELALRYFREQRAMVRSLPRVRSFKCGPPENARAWAAMRDEFFGGVDLLPGC